MDPNQQNPYDFILNPQSPTPTSGGRSPMPKGKQILISTVFISVVLIIVIIGASLILSIGGGSTDNLKAARASQAEIIRVLDEQSDNIRDRNLLYRTTTLKIALITDTAAMDGILSSQNVKLTKLELDAKLNTKLDQALESAAQQNTFDAEFRESLSSLLTKYQSELRSAASDVKKDSEVASLERAFNNVKIVELTAAQSN